MASKEKRWKPEEELLIASIRGEAIAPIAERCDMSITIKIASRHLISTVFASRIVDQDLRFGDSSHWAAAVLLRTERDMQAYLGSLGRIRNILTELGVPTIVLKGISLSLGRSRDIGDIDLLVREDELISVIGLLETKGYRYVGDRRNKRIRPSEKGNWLKLAEWANQFEFLDPENGTLIELHTTFFEKKRVYPDDLSVLNKNMEVIRQACVRDPQTGCLFLSMEDRVVLLALHAAIKRSPYRHDFVLRHIVDFDALIDAGFDWEMLIARAERLRVLPYVYFLIQLHRKFIGNRIDEATKESFRIRLRPKEIWLADIHVSCVTDLGKGAYGRALLYRFLFPFIYPSTRAAKARSILVLPLFFPEPWRIPEIYGLRPNSKSRFLLYLLEPARWIFLLISSIKGKMAKP